MSTEHHETEQSSGQPVTHTDVSFEAADINARTIFMYLVGLAVCVIVACGISVFVFKLASNAAAGSESQMPPSHQNVPPTMPPEPRLQGVPGHVTDPQFDLRAKMKEDSEANERLEYRDKQAGIAQIPVEEAMKIIVSKGSLGPSVAEGEKKK